ncbi:dTDP-4-dehydrorhamnose reductase [Bacillus sp. Xin]|uniref:dTDP-4-dehydrorhamnose reductase n=1 Tax=unclassified Bacillus (in: firmicutes) TaxID=185979 RepID=UPI00157291B7|nr:MULTISPECIES: dTDP-4-dehydrorhamnose reductase [unclassified Bacillus (in: firmicutes)]MBC6975851.1 dTDP-4-dehydrorhamnose reductase [Bacillus sp. Xin]NSW35146.1 dTDP-4-dehydrorhamnose reductase [Bacillus sp. Xin1]
MKKVIAITGAKGQLGRQFAEDLHDLGYRVCALSREDMDITDFSKVDLILRKINPNTIIHCAAYTKVDLAEAERDKAFLVNALGTRNVAVVAEKMAAKLVYISTDYVFDGKKDTGYDEFDTPNPINVYGASKYAGENFVKNFHSRHFIVRTSWLYGKYGNNFVETMLKLAKNQLGIKVVNDQTGSPTHVKDLVQCVKELMETELYGTYHGSNAGACTWYEFAKGIFSLCDIKVNTTPISTKGFSTGALRPAYSVLDSYALRLNGFHVMKPWREGLKEYLKEKERFRGK